MRQTYETTTTPDSNSQRAWDFMKANIREIAHNIKGHPAKVGASIAATIGITAAAAGCGTQHEKPQALGHDTVATSSPAKSSTSPEQKPAFEYAPLSQLQAEAEAGTLVNQPLLDRLYWASSQDKTVAAAEADPNAVDPASRKYYKVDTNESLSSSGAEIEADFLAHHDAGAHGFLPSNLASLDNDQVTKGVNLGISYYTSVWNDTTPEGKTSIDNLRQLYLNTLASGESYTSSGTNIVTSTEDSGSINIPDVGKVQSKTIKGILNGEKYTDVVAFVPYKAVDPNNTYNTVESARWVLQSRTFSK